MATSSTPWASVADPVLLMRMAMAFAMMSTTAWAPSTRAGFATVPARFMPAAARESPLEIATAMAASSTPWASVAAPVRRIRMAMAFVTTQKSPVAQIPALAISTQKPPMTTALAVSWTLSNYAEALVLPMRMAMVFAMMRTIAWAHSTPAVSAMAPAGFTIADARTFLKPTAIVMEAN